METGLFAFGLGLMVAVAALSVASRRLHVAPPIIMLVAGTVLAFVPGVPRTGLDPDVVLLILLPPLLYSAGVGLSWRGFRANLMPILLLAIGCVLATASAVATVMHFVFGFSWPLGFVLGAIVSPPDAVAPMALLRGMQLPRRITAILEGESLVNDATALVAFGFALAAVSTGHFSLASATWRFGEIVVGEMAYGVALGWAVLHLRHWANDARAEIVLALLAPFAAFWPPHALGASGVIACVAAGIWVSWNGRGLIRPSTRLQGYFIWDLVVWAIEALVFLLTGLQAHNVLNSLSQSWLRALAAAVLVTATMVIVRFAWVFAAASVGRLFPAGRHGGVADWRPPFFIAFTGLRGVVSLAAALAIPEMLNGAPFPERDILLFATFFAIAASLLALGLPLPALARRLGLARAGLQEARRETLSEHRVRISAIDAVLLALEHAERSGASPAAIAALRRRHGDRRDHLAASADTSTADDPVSDATAIQLQLINVERGAIGAAFDNAQISDAARRRLEREFDLEEARVHHAQKSARIIEPGTD